jgi:hypothetical protein
MRANQNNNNNNGHRRMRGRNGNNNNNNRKGPNPLTRSYESNGPDIKIRGSAQHIADKYAQLGRDAQVSSDPVAAESFFQHAEHYYRLIAEAQIQLYGEVQRPFDPAEGDEGFENTGQERPAFEPRPVRQNNEDDFGSQPQPAPFKAPRADYRQDHIGSQDRGQERAGQDRGQDRGLEREPGRFQRPPQRDRFDNSQGGDHQDQRFDRPERQDRNSRYDQQDRGDRFAPRHADSRGALPQDRGGQDRAGQERFERPRNPRFEPSDQQQDRSQERFEPRGFEPRSFEPRPPQNRERFERPSRFEPADRGERLEPRAPDAHNPDARLERTERPERQPRSARFEAPHFEPTRAPRRPAPPVQDSDDEQRLPAFLTNPVRGVVVESQEPVQDDVVHDSAEPVARPKRGRRKVMRVETDGLPEVPAAE